MSLELHDRIAIRRSFPEYGLQTGDVATLIAFVDHPGAGPRGCVLELFTAVGDSIAVVTVPEHTVSPLRADEALSVRPIATTAWAFTIPPLKTPPALR